jgi:hypothetical protein
MVLLCRVQARAMLLRFHTVNHSYKTGRQREGVLPNSEAAEPNIARKGACEHILESTETIRCFDWHNSTTTSSTILCRTVADSECTQQHPLWRHREFESLHLKHRPSRSSWASSSTSAESGSF